MRGFNTLQQLVGGLHPIFLGTYLLCMLLPLALMPIVAPCFWRRHYGKISILWMVVFTIFCVAAFPAKRYLVVFGEGWSPVDSPVDLVDVLQFLLFSYLPAGVMFFALLAISGGIRLTGKLVGTPKLNLALLVASCVISGCLGALIAIGLLIRPLLQANVHRRHQIHSIIFFAFIVINISGYITYTLSFLFYPPPLFLGFLRNDGLLWLGLAKACAVSAIILMLYFLLDAHLFRREGSPVQPNPKYGPVRKFRVEGLGSLLFLPALAAAAWLPAIWIAGPAFDIYARPLELSQIISYALMVGITIATSLWNRSKSC